MTQTIAVSAMPRKAVLELNNRHAVELSWLDPVRLEALLVDAFYARVSATRKRSSSRSTKRSATTARTSSGFASVTLASSMSTGSWWHPRHESRASRAGSTSTSLPAARQPAMIWSSVRSTSSRPILPPTPSTPPWASPNWGAARHKAGKRCVIWGGSSPTPVPRRSSRDLGPPSDTGYASARRSPARPRAATGVPAPSRRAAGPP